MEIQSARSRRIPEAPPVTESAPDFNNERYKAMQRGKMEPTFPKERPASKEEGAENAAIGGASTEKEKQPLSTLDKLKEKLEAFQSTKERHKALRQDIQEAEQLFAKLKAEKSPAEVKSLDISNKISEGLNTARHLAEIYEHIDAYGDEGRKADALEQGEEVDEPTPEKARLEAEARYKADLNLKRERAWAKRDLDNLEKGRRDEKDLAAQETEGLEGDDLTLPYTERMDFLRNKIVQRFKAVKNREPDQTEFDQLVYGVKHGGPPVLSRTERIGQWFRRAGEATLGKVFDMFADQSLKTAVQDYKKLEETHAKATGKLKEIEDRVAVQTAERARLKAETEDPSTRTKQQERLAQLERRRKMEKPPMRVAEAEMKKTAKGNAEVERKRRILARQKLEETEREAQQNLNAEKEAAKKFGNKQKLQELNAREPETADKAEREQATAEAFKKARLEKRVEKRLREWRTLQYKLKSFGEDWIDPKSKEGQEEEEKMRDQTIAEIKRENAEILARTGGTEDLFFGKEDALEERKAKDIETYTNADGAEISIEDGGEVDLSELEEKPAKTKNKPRKPTKAQIISEETSGNYTLEGADIPYPEKPITLDDITTKEAPAEYTLDKTTPPEEVPFVMGNTEPVREPAFRLKPAELALTRLPGAITDKEQQQENLEAVGRILRNANKLPPDAPDVVVADWVYNELKKHPIDWTKPEAGPARDKLWREQQTYQARLEHTNVDDEMRTELSHWINLIKHILALTQKTKDEQEEYVRALTPKAEEEPEHTPIPPEGDGIILRPKTVKLKMGKEVEKREEKRVERERERAARQRVDTGTQLFLKELEDIDTSNTDEEPIERALAILKRIRAKKLEESEIQAGLKELLDNRVHIWVELRDKPDHPKSAQMERKLVIAKALADLLQLPLSIPAKTRISHERLKTSETTPLDTIPERFSQAEIEFLLENSLEQHGLSAQKIINAIKAEVKKQERNSAEWEQTLKLLKRSVLFVSESNDAPINTNTIAQRFLESLALYRAAEIEDKKRDVFLLKTQLINSLAPRLGLGKALKSWDNDQSETRRQKTLIPEGISDALNTYAKPRPKESTAEAEPSAA